MKNGQKLKLGDVHVTPINIQEVQASKLGDAQGIPFFINKNIRTLYFYCFIYYVLFLERQLFCFQFFFLCCSICLDPSIFCLERDTLRFHCLEHSSFHSYHFVSVHFLLVLRLALVVHSYFVQSLMFFLVCI